MVRCAVRPFLLLTLALASQGRPQTSAPPPSWPPDGAEQAQPTGGIGLTLRETENKEYHVAQVQEAGPADKAGVKPSDVLLRVDDESILAYTLAKLARRLAGDPGTTVKLSLRRSDGRRLELNVVRADLSPRVPGAAGPPGQSPPAPLPEVKATDSSSSETLHLKRVSVRDDAEMISGEAFSLLLPDDWKIEGGVCWRVHPAAPAYLAFKARSPDGRETVEALPAERFVWSQAGIPFFPSGSVYLGNEVAPPPPDATVFIEQYVLPRFRSKARSLRILSCEDLPKVAEAVEPSLQEPGVPARAKAAKVRIEYAEDNQAYEEDLYAVLVFGQPALVDYTLWGTERLFACRAPKGQLEERTKLFRTITASLQFNLAWFNKYLQLVDLITKNQLQAIRQTGELSRYIARVHDQTNELRRQAWENHQRTQQRVSFQFSQGSRDLAHYRDPIEQRLVELPSGYRRVWSNPQGEYLLSHDATFDPNNGAPRRWQRMEEIP